MEAMQSLISNRYKNKISRNLSQWTVHSWEAASEVGATDSCISHHLQRSDAQPPTRKVRSFTERTLPDACTALHNVAHLTLFTASPAVAATQN